MRFALRADRQTIVVGGTLGLVALLVLGVIIHFWSMRQQFADEIEGIQPRTARLSGMLEHADELEAATAVARNVVRDVAYPPGRDSATVAATMQQDVRGVMAAAGMSVTGSQVLTTRRAEGYDQLSLDVTAEGNINALDEAMAELEMMRPLIFVESARFKPERRRSRRSAQNNPDTDPRRVTARLKLFALRSHE